MSALVEHIASHLRRAICTYAEGDDTRATELTGEELRDIARAIIPLVLEKAVKVAEAYRDRQILIVAETKGECGEAADAAWHANKIAAAIRAIGAP